MGESFSIDQAVGLLSQWLERSKRLTDFSDSTTLDAAMRVALHRQKKSDAPEGEFLLRDVGSAHDNLKDSYERLQELCQGKAVCLNEEIALAKTRVGFSSGTSGLIFRAFGEYITYRNLRGE